MGFAMKLRMIAAALLCFTVEAGPNLKTFTPDHSIPAIMKYSIMGTRLQRNLGQGRLVQLFLPLQRLPVGP
ncbi:hypothetical protein RHSIM_Rhsim08G0023900 [Rhododendron simsii]|uniref:Uncharacterized protein n=1 Tax=Rhododendron simsii TaxID=118357 RepID=A0A834GGH9_RHOSS|nr:hypothetical protein RHSIM_Rhsim08G0023900 [Rhododendron simsii]